jgi:hypothetical protein
MKTFKRRTSQGIVVTLGLLLCGLSASVLAQNGTGEKKALPEYTVEMRDMPWKSVWEWLTDKTGRPFISGAGSIQGSLSFIGKKGQKYTMPQVIDIINDGLLAHKWVLLNRGTSFTLVPADEKIPPELVPRIAIEELNEHGNTEIVSTVYRCKSLVAEDSAPEVKKQMGPFGEIVPLVRANALLLQDTVANIKRIKKELDDQEGQEGTSQAETFIHPCKFIYAREAERALRDFLGEQKQTVEVVRQPGGGGGGPNPMGFGKGKGGGGGGGGGPNFPGGDGGDGADQFAGRRPASTTRVRSYTVASDERTNTVFVKGPADIISQAKTLMKNIDVGTFPIVLGAPELKTYPVKEGNAQELAKTLKELHKSSFGIKIEPIGNTQIMVLAPPNEQITILSQINGIRPPPSKTESLPLYVLDATKAVDTLQKLFADSKGSALVLEPDPSRNAVIVKGSPDQVAEVKQVLAAIGESKDAQTGATRIISLSGNAAALAEEIKRAFSELRPENPVKVIGADSGFKVDADKKEAPKSDGKPSEGTPSEGAPQKKAAVDFSGEPYVFVSFQDGPELAPPPKKDADKNAGKGAPVVITAVGNKLIIKSEDPEALQLVSDLVRYFTTAPAGDFEVIRLKHANAVDTAKLLDELFNGAKPAATGGGFNFPGKGKGGGFGFPGQFGGFPGQFPGAGAPAAQREEKIRVVADAATNALLVQASPL